MSNIIAKYRHGSEDSQDIDVYYVFDELPDFHECKEFCDETCEENRNIITINNGIVSGCYKGTIDEINNGLLVTYPLHKQEYPLLVERKVERDRLIKSIRVMRCFLSHHSRTIYRSVVKNALNSPSWKVRICALKSIDLSSIKEYGCKGTKEDVIKVFAFQLCQRLALSNDVEIYTKKQAIEVFQSMEKYLYRKPNADLGELIFKYNRFVTNLENVEVEQIENFCYFPHYNKLVDLVTEKYIEKYE
jgi:hypothetical protein